MFPIGVASFADLFVGEQLYVYIFMSIANAALIFFASMKFILVLQQCGYHGKRYFKWLSNKDTPYMSRLMLLCMLALLFFCVLNMTFEPILGKDISSYIGFLSYILFTVMYINTESHVNAKIPIKKTKRLVRLCITFCLMLLIITFGLITLLNLIAYSIGNEVFALLRFALICVMPLLIPIILFLAYCINEPIEYLIRRYYLAIAINKLNNSNVIKVGITGSYGKTSVKEILKTILSSKYRVLATPASYNTPLGIARTVKNLDSTHDVFIAEMGARNKGDIKELALMVKPKYAVLTGVNNQHLEMFKTIDNIVETKYELFDNMDKDGVGIFTSDNEYSRALNDRFPGEKYLAGLDGEENLVTATGVQNDENGTSFTLVIKGEEPVKCSTVLLGTHSVKNICVASAVAYKMGLTPSEIATGINRIQTIGHRLELVPNNKKIVIIDDSYNSNVNGIDAAMEVLDSFKGRKIVLTPGLVELGKMENVENLKFGKLLASHADIVIIIGKHNAEMLINGLIDGGFNRENIKFARTLNKGNAMLNEIVEEGDVVLFENDLPDNYN